MCQVSTEQATSYHPSGETGCCITLIIDAEVFVT